jgi:hypothetical protein
MKCPSCNELVDSANINIQTDLGKCQHCDHIFKISEEIDTVADGFDINTPPKGAWFTTADAVITLGATTRSAIAFFLVPFALIWSGGSLGGIYGSQIVSGEFNILFSLFGIPFLLGSIMIWTIASMAIWGKVEITITENGGTVFTGLGKLGLRKHFTWQEISKITEKPTVMNYPGKRGNAIQLSGSKSISFGTGLSESRKYYVMSALQVIAKRMKKSSDYNDE